MPSKPGKPRRGGALLTRAPAESKSSEPALGFSSPRKNPGAKRPERPAPPAADSRAAKSAAQKTNASRGKKGRNEQGNDKKGQNECSLTRKKAGQQTDQRDRGQGRKNAAKQEAKKRQTTTETKPHCPFGFVSLAVAGRRARGQCGPTPCLAQRPPQTQEQQRPRRRQKQRRKQRPQQQPKQQRPKRQQRQQRQQQKQKSNEPVAQPKRRAQTHCNFKNQPRARRFRPAPAAAKRNE